jgi:hypothetical protein
MRITTTVGRRPVRTAVRALALVAALAAPAKSQVNPVVFDGNIVFSASAGLYAGAASAGSPCVPGLDSTTVSIATVQFTRNSNLDPLLSGALVTASPNWRPAAGSPAFCANGLHPVLDLPNDGFFRQVDFAGALGATEPDWTAGWTYYGLDGGGRTFPVRPVVVVDNHNFYADRTFSADSNYLVRGQLRVKEQASLTIQAGTHIFEETATVGTIIIERGAKIFALGESYAPIVLTSDAAPGSQTPGGIGGIFVHGRARTNAVNSCAGDSAASEGGVVGHYGGNDDADDSGVIRYLRSEFAGVQVGPNNEANGLTLNAVGSGTEIHHIQSHRSSDDLFELFGGTAQVSHLVLTYGEDDGFDWQMGYRGKAQFVVIRQIAGAAGTERGIEADNNEFNNATELCSGRSFPTLSNFTILGDLTAGSGVVDGVFLRRGTGATFLNSIIAYWKSNALELNGAETFANHCADRAGIAGLVPAAACAAGVNPDAVVFDGNLLWDNGASGGDHYAGAASAGSPCVPGLDSTTVSIATVQYTNNSVADPLLSGALVTASPNWAPALGSPAYAGNAGHGRTVNVPVDGFFQPVCFTGAVSHAEDWTAGWTYYGLDGGGRTFPVRPVVVVDNHNFYADRTFSADSNYLVRGQLRVKEQASLTIQAGTHIFEETATVGTIIIERGAKIFALGESYAPIVLTSDAAPGSQTPGGIGGIFVHGRARTNAVNSCAGDSAASEGGVVGHYGGNDDADDSGVIRYLRSEFAGVQVGPNNEANGLTLNAVGSGTEIHHIQSHRSSDDLFELFGGTAQVSHLVLTYGEDDGFDWQMGYRGKAQFVVIRQIAGAAGTERGIEADNNEFNNATELCSGRSFPTLSNFTILGDKTAGSGVVDGVFLRRGTSAVILNSIIAYWKSNALELNGAETFRNHCADRSFAYGPGVRCSQATTDVGGTERAAFTAFALPNPVRNELQIRFTLPAAGRVDVDVFGADGRLVRTLARGERDAGAHTVTWSGAGELPVGTYFYRVRTPGRQATGRFVRLR